MTLSEPADNPAPAPPAAGVTLDLGAALAAAGGTITVPPDLPFRLTRYHQALEVARSFAPGILSIYLPELGEMRALITAALGGDPYAPGGLLHEHAVALDILDAVASLLAEGWAAAEAAAQASAPVEV